MTVPASFLGTKDWVWGLFRKDKRVATLLDLLGIVGGCFTAVDVATRIGAFASHNEKGRFQIYIWTTFACTAVGAVSVLLLYATVRRDLRKGSDAIRLGSDAAKIQHEMAEAVRRCARDPKGYKAADDLRPVMALLKKYLRSRLGDFTYALTVKRVEKRRLIKVFRDDEQHEKRIVGDRISLEESPVFMRFSQGPAGKKIVYISDTEQMTLLEDKFRSRASVCGYRSILAFPLRMPRAFPRDGSESTAEGEDSVKIANLLGFFSIDTPDVGTLDGLLEGSRSIRDDDREPKGDLDIFYGLADSMATILMLGSEAATQGGGNTG